MKLKNKKWTEEEFFKVRKDVLTHWTTGKDIDLQKAVDYLKNLPKHKEAAFVLLKLRKLPEA